MCLLTKLKKRWGFLFFPCISLLWSGRSSTSAKISPDLRNISSTVHAAAGAQRMLFSDSCPRFLCRTQIEKCELENQKARWKKKSRLGIIHARLWSRLHSPQGHIFLNPQLPSQGRNMAEESRWPSSSPCTGVWGENGGRERGLLHQPHSCKRRRILHQRWWTAEVSLVEQGEKSGSKREPWMLLSSSTSAAKGS